MGATPRLLNKGLVYDPLKAKEERLRLYTKTVCTIQLQLSVVLRNMKPHKVKTDASAW